MPEVSVIVPNYNHAGFLKKRLDSILGQDFQDFEIILLDDHSSDNSRLILDQYTSNEKVTHYIKSETNSGSPFIQWIKAFAFCKGTYVWIAESDDYCESSFLSKCISVFRKDDDIGMVYSASRSVTVDGRMDDHFQKWVAEVSRDRWNKDYIGAGQEEIIQALAIRNIIGNTSSVVMRRATVAPLIHQVARFRYTGDWYLWLLVLSQPKVKVGFVAEPLNYFRSAHEQSTRTKTKFGYLYIDEWFQCLYLARVAVNQPRYPAKALADVRFMLLAAPLSSFFKQKAPVKLVGWLFKDTLFFRMVVTAILSRGIKKLSIKLGR